MFGLLHVASFFQPFSIRHGCQPNDDDQTDVERFETRTDTSWTSFGHEQDLRSQACPLSNETDDTRHSGSQKGHGPQLAENEPFL